MEVETGATNEQVEAAAEQWKLAKEYPKANPLMAHIAITMAASYLVPSDARIVALADLQKLRNGWGYERRYEPAYDMLERIDALIKGGS